MGYYSEVAIKLNKVAVDAMPDEVRDTLERLLPLEQKWDNGMRLYRASYIKWNDDYDDDVKSVMDFLYSLDKVGECVEPGDEEKPYWEFLRVGEGDGDEEHMGNGEWDELWVERSIGWN